MAGTPEERFRLLPIRWEREIEREILRSKP